MEDVNNHSSGQVLYSQTEIFGNKNSQDSVDVVDGRVVECGFVVGNGVPYGWERITDHMQDRNVCDQTTIKDFVYNTLQNTNT